MMIVGNFPTLYLLLSMLSRLIGPLTRSPTRSLIVGSVGVAVIAGLGGRGRMGVASSSANIDPMSFEKGKPESEWRAQLSPQQFEILRQKGTEMAGSGKYYKHSKKGVYECAGCGTPLYTSGHKFDSSCGWPAYFDALPGAVTRHEDKTFGMTRIEITCAACGGHLGHVFKGEGYKTPTDERHCVNSVSLNFKDE